MGPCSSDSFSLSPTRQMLGSYLLSSCGSSMRISSFYH